VKRIIFLIFLASSLQSALIKVPNAQYYSGAPDVRGHPGHLPFISYLSFRNICDHTIDQSTEYFDPEKVKQGDLIYVNVWYLDWFMQQVHEEIRFPYLLVSGDVGDWLPNPSLKKLLFDPKLAAWFCRNIIFSDHPKIFQLPMGQDFALFTLDVQPVQDLLKEIQNLVGKETLLYMNHFPREQGDRKKLVKLFENEPYCLSRNQSDQEYRGVGFSQYIREMASSYFVLSPMGLEMDCVRTWEALALGTIPIVEHTFLDPIYRELPVLIVEDWEEISPSLLREQYEVLKGRKQEKAYFKYWEELIFRIQEKVRKNDCAFSQLESTQFSARELKDLKDILSDCNCLIYKGFLSSIRPLQLSGINSSLASILVYDPWMDNALFAGLDRYIQDTSFLKEKKRVRVIDIPYILDGPQSGFYSLLQTTFAPYTVFLDLTYYRQSLLTDFTKDFKSPRHLLKRDVREVYHHLAPFSLLCGNAAQDEYVRKVLSQVFQELGVDLQWKGSFWSVFKTE